MEAGTGLNKKLAIILIVTLIGALIVTIILNIQNTKTDVAMVASAIDIDNGDLKIDWTHFDNYDVELTKTLTITKSGVYHLTGSLTNGNIIVNAYDGKVKLILDNATIKSPDGPAIACYAADDLVIELVGENTLSDSKTYASSYDQDIAGAIYSKADLTFQGDGRLTLNANHEDGIVSKDDLKFNSGTYNITAVDDGIRGKDSVYIVYGNFTINAKADAIKSTNEATAGKGFVLIEKGSFNLTAIAKGIKAINSILIYDGDFTINSTDDAIHTNNYISIMNGNFVINSGDDGIHANKKLIIEDGDISIKKSYEGIEAQAITINGGDISIVSSDDGMNAGGGADASATNRPGAGAFDVDSDCMLIINDGKIYVNASGDGIDSNGYLYFNGGTVVVDGPTNNGNGALDAGAGIMMNGGEVIAIGASGMAETLGNNSSIYNIGIYFSSTQVAGTKIEIKDASGETIINHTSAKTFNHMSAGTPAFKQGETYTIYLNDDEYTTFTISSITTTVGNGGGNFNNGPAGGINEAVEPNQNQGGLRR